MTTVREALWEEMIAARPARPKPTPYWEREAPALCESVVISERSMASYEGFSTLIGRASCNNATGIFAGPGEPGEASYRFRALKVPPRTVASRFAVSIPRP